MGDSAVPQESEEEPERSTETEPERRSRSWSPPSALDLARLGRRPLFPPGSRDLYQHLLRLVELGPGQEFVLAPCGRGATTVFLAQASGATGAGTDPDAELVASAQAAARAAGLQGRLHFEQAELGDLPYKDAVFDVAIGEVGLASADKPEAAVRELVRVTRRLGKVALVELTWARTPEPERREEIIDRLGLRPALLVEWKQMLRDAGVVELHVEDWSEVAPLLGDPLVLSGLADARTLRERLGLLADGWWRWALHVVRRVRPGEHQLWRRLTRERILGLSLISGTKWQDD